MKDEIIVEKFGGFLRKIGGFLAGDSSDSAQSGVSTFTGRVQGMSDPVADSYSAEALKSSLLVTYNKLDQIIEAIKRINPADVGAAKSEAMGIVNFIQEAFKKVTEIIEDARNIPAGERSRTLNDISKKLNSYILAGGEIDKWKDKWLGKYNSRLGGYEFYQKGKSLVQQANKILQEIQASKEMQEEIAQTEIQNSIKRGLESFSGKTEEKPEKPKKGEERKKDEIPKKKKPFSKEDPEYLKSLRQRLVKIGVPVGSKTDGFSDKEDGAAIQKGMTYLGTVSGKQYGSQNSDIEEFFNDLGIFIKNRAKVLK